MSIYLSLDAGEPHFLASNQGWGDVVTWADAMDADKYPALVGLVEHGISEDLPGVLKEITVAIVAAPPDADVKAVLDELADAMKGEATVATINNGMASQEEDTPAKRLRRLLTKRPH